MGRASVVRAVEFHGQVASFTRPLAVTCDVVIRYFVKARQRGRVLDCSLVNTLVTGRLAAVLGAPVPKVAIVELEPSFLSRYGLVSVEPGPGCGCQEVPDAIEMNCAFELVPGVPHGIWQVPPEVLQVLRDPANRSRLAALALLFAWVGLPGPAWRSLLHQPGHPPLVHAVDFEHHGHPLPAGVDDWLGLALDARVGLRVTDLGEAAARAEGISAEVLAVLADTPPEWAAAWTADLDGRRRWLLSTLARQAEGPTLAGVAVL